MKNKTYPFTVSSIQLKKEYILLLILPIIVPLSPSGTVYNSRTFTMRSNSRWFANGSGGMFPTCSLG